jgi:hypothetical protein
MSLQSDTGNGADQSAGNPGPGGGGGATGNIYHGGDGGNYGGGGGGGVFPVIDTGRF